MIQKQRIRYTRNLQKTVSNNYLVVMKPNLWSITMNCSNQQQKVKLILPHKTKRKMLPYQFNIKFFAEILHLLGLLSKQIKAVRRWKGLKLKQRQFKLNLNKKSKKQNRSTSIEIQVRCNCKSKRKVKAWVACSKRKVKAWVACSKRKVAALVECLLIYSEEEKQKKKLVISPDQQLILKRNKRIKFNVK